MFVATGFPPAQIERFMEGTDRGEISSLTRSYSVNYQCSPGFIHITFFLPIVSIFYDSFEFVFSSLLLKSVVIGLGRTYIAGVKPVS